MSDILKRVIEKAVEGGWNELEDFTLKWVSKPEDSTKGFNWSWIDEYDDGEIELLWGDSHGMQTRSLNDIIFSHSFAKALVRTLLKEKHPEIMKKIGKTPVEDILKCADDEYPFTSLWLDFLVDEVLSDDRIKYLEGFL